MDPEPDEVVFDTVNFDNGDYYEGDTLGRVPHGEGTMFYAGGLTVSGRWVYGERVSPRKRDDAIPSGTRDKVIVNDHILYVGYGYDNDTISGIFGISRFIRGIRIHHDRAVLLSTGDAVYKDGIGWERDEDGEYVFIYTGEGLHGDQELKAGNFFLRNSSGKGLYLFIRRKPDDYVFHGEVLVKRTYTADEKDKGGRMRKVFKFVLTRV